MGIMEEIKRKYVKKSHEGKISIKYFLNMKIKPEVSESGENVYPLYFQLLIKGKNTINKSRIDDDEKYSIERLKKIENIINSDTKINFKNFRECINTVRNLFRMESSVLNNSDEVWLVKILREKMLINEIIKDLKPFEREHYNIKEFNDRFDIYHDILTESIAELLRITIKRILFSKIKSNTNVDTIYLLDIINWKSSNPYHLYLYLKDKYQDINDLITLFPYCFQIVSDIDLKLIPESRDWLLYDFFNNATYVEIYLDIKSLPNDLKNKDLEDTRDKLVDAINREIHSLFLTQ